MHNLSVGLGATNINFDNIIFPLLLTRPWETFPSHFVVSGLMCVLNASDMSLPLVYVFFIIDYEL